MCDVDRRLDRSIQTKLALLVNRLTHSTGEDRLDAIEQMQSMCENGHIVDVGHIGMADLIEVLMVERDEQIIVATLDILTTLVSVTKENERTSVDKNMDMLLQKSVMEKLLVLLKQKKLWMRFKSIQLLCVVAETRAEKIGSMVLGVEAGMLRLIEALSDTREEVRNQMLLLLKSLTETNAEIQQFCAFSQVFNTLLKIMIDEGLADGGAVVIDCLQILYNCVSRNEIVRKIFLEPGECVRGMLPVLSSAVRHKKGGELASLETAETSTKLSDEIPQDRKVPSEDTMRIVLLIISSLVTPDRGDSKEEDASRRNMDEAARKELRRRAIEQRRRSQEKLMKLGYVDAIAQLALDVEGDARAYPDIRVLALDTLGHVVGGNVVVQAHLDQVLVSTARESAALRWMRVALDGEQIGTVLRTSVSTRDRPRGHTMRDAAVRAFRCAQSNEDATMTWIGHAIRPQQALAVVEVGTKMKFARQATTTSTPGALLIRRLVSHAENALNAETKSRQADELWAHFRCARLFQHVLEMGGETTRMLALRIPAESSSENVDNTQQEYLLQRCLRILSRSREYYNDAKDADSRNIIRVLQCSLIRLLCAWLWQCPRAVDEVVTNASSLFLYDFVADAISTSSKTSSRISRVNVSGQWTCFLIGCCMVHVSDDCSTTSSHILRSVMSRVGLRHFLDSFVLVKSSKRWAKAKESFRKKLKSVYDDPNPIFASRGETLRGLPPTVDCTCVPFIENVTTEVPRHMIDMYASSPSSSSSSDMDTTQRDAISLERMMKVQRSLIYMQERQKQHGRVDNDDEPELVKLMDEFQAAVEKADLLELKQQEERQRFESEIKARDERIAELTKACESMKITGSRDGETKSTKSKVTTDPSSSTSTSQPSTTSQNSFLAMGTAVKHFAEVEALKVERDGLVATVKRSEKQIEDLTNLVKRSNLELEKTRSTLKSKDGLEAEQGDLLVLLAHVEAKRMALSKALHAMGGKDAVRDAERDAISTLEKVANGAANTREDEKEPSAAVRVDATDDQSEGEFV